MLLQKGKFTISNINELKKCPKTHDGIRRVIDLAYMGKFEYEGNAIPISRMFIEYYRDKYQFYPIEIFSPSNEQMYLYANSDIVSLKLKDNPNFINDLIKNKIDWNMTLWNYVKHDKNECLYDFWWDIEGDYFIFFGDEKKELINYFINSCYVRDGEHEEIGKKIVKAGYKLK